MTKVYMDAHKRKLPSRKVTWQSVPLFFTRHFMPPEH